jgi:four helix bundle protein
VLDHKSLVAWQLANQVVRGVLSACRSHWKPHAAALLGQLQRSSLSVQLNIAEGYALRKRRQFSYHLRVAYGSAVETGDLLELASAEQLLPEGHAEALLADCRESQRVLLGLLHRYERPIGPRST